MEHTLSLEALAQGVDLRHDENVRRPGGTDRFARPICGVILRKKESRVPFPVRVELGGSETIAAAMEIKTG